jgi:hypothetical protein
VGGTGIPEQTLCNWLKAEDKVKARGQDPQALSESELARHSRDDLDALALALNTRPRKTLGWKTPAEALDELLVSVQ